MERPNGRRKRPRRLSGQATRNNTATGLQAALIRRFPVLWGLGELIETISNIPNPVWFQSISVAMALAFGELVLALSAVSGALTGRFGG